MYLRRSEDFLDVCTSIYILCPGEKVGVGGGAFLWKSDFASDDILSDILHSSWMYVIWNIQVDYLLWN